MILHDPVPTDCAEPILSVPVIDGTAVLVGVPIAVVATEYAVPEIAPDEIVFVTCTRKYPETLGIVYVLAVAVPEAVVHPVVPLEDICQRYVNVPFVDHVPVDALKTDPTLTEPVMTGNTEFVTFEEGTITVAAVFAVVL